MLEVLASASARLTRFSVTYSSLPSPCRVICLRRPSLRNSSAHFYLDSHPIRVPTSSYPSVSLVRTIYHYDSLSLDSVFQIEVRKVLPNDQLQQWIPTDRVSTVDCEIRPLRSLDTGIVQFQLVVESSLAPPQPAEVKSPAKKT